MHRTILALVVIGIIVGNSHGLPGLPKSRIRRSMDSSLTSIESHPYMVSIQLDGVHVCGGTIISATIILTDSFCISVYSVNSVKVGSSSTHSGGSRHAIEKIIKHPDFARSLRQYDSTATLQEDVALLTLETPIKLDGKIARVVQLFNENETLAEESSGVVIGWGAMYDGQSKKIDVDSFHKKHGMETGDTSVVNWKLDERVTIYPRHLRSIDVSVVSKSRCEDKFAREDLKGLICAETHGKGVCSRDSGGPLMIGGRQAGIVSKHTECDETIAGPSAFTDISVYREWIDRNVKELTPVVLREVTLLERVKNFLISIG